MLSVITPDQLLGHGQMHSSLPECIHFTSGSGVEFTHNVLLHAAKGAHEFRVGRGLGNNPLRVTASGQTVKIAVVDLTRREHGKTNSHSLEVTLPASHASFSL